MLDWTVVAADGGALVALLVLFGLVRRLPRKRLRRSLILYVPFVVVATVCLLLPEQRDAPWFQVTSLVGELLGLLLLINLVAIVLFDVLLRLVRLRFPEILHDLSVGAAYLVALVWWMHEAGVNLASIVATSAVVTAVVGLSLQSTLGSIIGGLALQMDDTISEGDWVELENKTQGLVKRVRWRHTVIETRNWDTLIVPNNQLLNQTITVLGKREGQPVQHRMWVYFNVDFRFSPTEVIRCVDAALQAAPIEGAALEPKPHAICFDLARDGRDSVAYYAVRYWLNDLARDDPTSSAVRERVFAALGRAQIPLALPAATLFVSNETSEWRERKRRKRREAVFAALRGVELFDSLSDQELAELAATVKPAPFAAGEVVTRQGARAHWLYVLTSGRVEVRVEHDGSETVVAQLEAPSFFGEMALMTGAAREATVVALSQVQCLRVDREDFSALVKARPEIANEISLILARRRVELASALEGIDANRDQHMQNERSRILEAIRSFFSL
jgi:CRP-like cAMP-binding protein/small-conductance mechanosensitive channel